MAKLIVVRHGATTYNEKGLWCGFIDAPLTANGRAEARVAASEIKGLSIDLVYSSDLIRSQQTWSEMAQYLHLEKLPRIIAPELKERDYGELAGQNKWEMKEKYGEEKWMAWRRGWDADVPGGENLHDVYNRVIPYYEREILPKLKAGQNILLSIHGNSMRALVKYLDHISDEDIPKLEIPTGGVYIYDIDSSGQVVNKETRGPSENKY